jgi:mono/diheme cytochrome c family protein
MQAGLFSCDDDGRHFRAGAVGPFAERLMKSLAAFFVLYAAGLGLAYAHGAAATAAPGAAASEAKPYTVKDGKVDMGTYKGYLYYGDSCMRCHGPDGLGSSYAPNLTDSLHHLTKDQFEETVINGKKDVNQSSDLVMPSFGLNQDVAENLDNIYAYLKARSDGALGRGHPEHLEP